MGFTVVESGHGRYDRVTKSGRKLWYDLKVIQQPERARACGSGPKSSADRRPVDPPPVVELHVFEGEDWAHKTDITFNYNANFFLYTTLGHARQMAHGRVQTPAATSPPILSGMPVSGMAYLDRPTEAGYFLFPDLSVRHEGRYRLDFALYEQMKDEDDEDAAAAPADSIYAPCGNFSYRMTINSCDFSVFSAKKFPGLTESTSLSRTVAEQGCRVRIRRDVRMRRREGKGGAGGAGGDYDGAAADEDYARRQQQQRRTHTPESVRARSMSNHSVERTPYGPELQRRPSGVDYPPPPHSADGASSGYLHFGGPQRDPQYPQYPAQHGPPPPPAPPAPQQSSSSVPPSPGYAPVSSYPPPPPPASFVYSERPPTGYRPAQRDVPMPDYHRRPSEPDYHRRPSMESVPPPPPTFVMEDRRPTLPGLDTMHVSSMARPHADSIGSSARSLSLSSHLPSPPKLAAKYNPMSVGALLQTAQQTSQTISDLRPPMVDLTNGAGSGTATGQQQPSRGQKRQRDDSEPAGSRLVNGARQSGDHSAPSAAAAEGQLLQFKRAAGYMDTAPLHEQ